MDLPDDLSDILKRMFAEFIDEKKSRSNNPEDYPRAVQIVDVEALQLHADCLRKRKKLDELMSEAQAEFHESEGVKVRLFMRLQKLYPAIALEDGGARFSSWKGKVYYLGWDKQEGAREAAPKHPEGGETVTTPIPAGETITEDDINRLLKGSPDLDTNNSTKSEDDDECEAA